MAFVKVCGGATICINRAWLDRFAYVLLAILVPIFLWRFPRSIRRKRVRVELSLRTRGVEALCCLLLAGCTAALAALDRGHRVASVCSLCMWLACLALALTEVRAGLHPSSSMRLLWLLNAAFALVSAPSQLTPLPTSPVAILRLTTSFLCVALGLVAFLEPATPHGAPALLPVGGGVGTERLLPLDDAPAHGESTASFAATLSFSWTWSMLKLGSSRPLEQTDMFVLDSSDSTAYHATR